jgi:hypothetical protein
MSEVQALLRHYAEVRNRLRFPPNAVPDTGINLQRKKIPPPSLTILETPERKSGLTPRQQKRLDTYRESFRRKDITFKTILEFVAAEFDVEYRLVLSRRRTVKMVLPRQVAFYLANKHIHQSLSSMAQYLGRDHTTVLHGRNKIRLLIATNPDFSARIKAMEAKLLENYPGLAVSAVNECPVEIEPGEGPQVSEIFGLDCGSRSTFCDAETGSHQDVEGAFCNATTAIQETSAQEQ